PSLSWAHGADRHACASRGEVEYTVNGLDRPRSLTRQPYQPTANPPVASLLAAQRRPATPSTAVASTAPGGTAQVPEPRAGGSVYRTPTGFRASSAPAAPGTPDSSAPAPVSVKSLIDSSPALPDTNEFTLKPYHTRSTPDYVARPTHGHDRHNCGPRF